MKIIHQLALLFLFFVFLPSVGSAELNHVEGSIRYSVTQFIDGGDSILQPIRNLELYDNIPENGWKVALHGIRHTMLHPTVWGSRRDQGTESHRMIPLKHYYLRSSERSTYRLKRFELTFRFDGVGQKSIEAKPESTAPIVEIGFGGEYLPGAGAQPPQRDRGYALRLSAFPSLPSTLLYRSGNTIVSLSRTKELILSTGEQYTVLGELTETGAIFTLNGKPWLELNEPGLERGLVSIIGGWHPVRFSRLVFFGEDSSSGAKMEESGVVTAPKAGRSKKRKRGKEPKSPKGNEVLDKMLFEGGE